MSEMEFSSLTVGKTALVLDQKDNVAIALTDLIAGDSCVVTEGFTTRYCFGIYDGGFGN